MFFFIKNNQILLSWLRTIYTEPVLHFLKENLYERSEIYRLYLEITIKNINKKGMKCIDLFNRPNRVIAIHNKDNFLNEESLSKFKMKVIDSKQSKV